VGERWKREGRGGRHKGEKGERKREIVEEVGGVLGGSGCESLRHAKVRSCSTSFHAL
jgi:hypothetical protein